MYYYYSLKIQPDNKILVGHIESTSNVEIMRINPDGLIDSSFGNNGFILPDFSNCNNAPTSLIFQSDGKILSSGIKSEPGTDSADIFIARVQNDLICDLIVDSISTTFITETSAEITWLSLTEIYIYKIYYRPVGTIDWFVTYSDTNYCLISSLIPSTIYEFKVNALCDVIMEGKNSDINTFTTLNTPLNIIIDAFTEIKIYPNPAKNSIHIDFNDLNTNTINVNLYSLSGSLLHTFSNTIISNNFVIDNLSEGFYIVETSVNERIYINKVFITN